MKKNTRQRSHPRPDTAEKNKQLESEKDKIKRAKCRDTITNTNLCLDCSKSALCSSEATSDWLDNQDDED